MTRKRTTHDTRPTVPAHWDVSPTVRLRNRQVTPGTRLRIRGERGTFTFRQFVRNTRTGAEWLDVNATDAGTFRAFRPERVASIPRRQARAA